MVLLDFSFLLYDPEVTNCLDSLLNTGIFFLKHISATNIIIIIITCPYRVTKGTRLISSEFKLDIYNPDLVKIKINKNQKKIEENNSIAPSTVVTSATK